MNIDHRCVCLINFFSSSLMAQQNNLECLSLSSVFEMVLYLLVKPKRAWVKHLTASNSKKALIQGWKNLPRTNTLAYLAPPSVTKKSFMNIAYRCVCLIKLLSLSLEALQNNLECLSLKNVFEMMLYLLVKPKRAWVKHLTASNSKKAHIPGWKNLPRTNTLAYFAPPSVTKKKVLWILPPDCGGLLQAEVHLFPRPSGVHVLLRH